MRARDAGPADLGRLYADGGEALAGVAARLCGEEDAADFMQDAFVRGLARIGTARQYWPLETWMFSIMIAESRRRAVAGPVFEALPREEALATLPLRQREIAFLRYFADLDEASIAARLGIHRGSVASTLYRVRERVR